MSDFRVITLLKDRVSSVETLVSLIMLTIFTLLFIWGNEMEREHTELKKMPEEASQNILLRHKVSNVSWHK